LRRGDTGGGGGHWGRRGEQVTTKATIAEVLLYTDIGKLSNKMKQKAFKENRPSVQLTIHAHVSGYCIPGFVIMASPCHVMMVGFPTVDNSTVTLRQLHGVNGRGTIPE